MDAQNEESIASMKSAYSKMMHTDKLQLLYATAQVKTIARKLQSGEKERAIKRGERESERRCVAEEEFWHWSSI